MNCSQEKKETKPNKKIIYLRQKNQAVKSKNSKTESIR